MSDENMRIFQSLPATGEKAEGDLAATGTSADGIPAVPPDPARQSDEEIVSGIHRQAESELHYGGQSVDAVDWGDRPDEVNRHGMTKAEVQEANQRADKWIAAHPGPSELELAQQSLQSAETLNAIHDAEEAFRLHDEGEMDEEDLVYTLGALKAQAPEVFDDVMDELHHGEIDEREPWLEYDGPEDVFAAEYEDIMGGITESQRLQGLVQQAEWDEQVAEVQEGNQQRMEAASKALSEGQDAAIKLTQREHPGLNDEDVVRGLVTMQQRLGVDILNAAPKDIYAGLNMILAMDAEDKRVAASNLVTYRVWEEQARKHGEERRNPVTNQWEPTLPQPEPVKADYAAAAERWIAAKGEPAAQVRSQMERFAARSQEGRSIDEGLNKAGRKLKGESKGGLGTTQLSW